MEVEPGLPKLPIGSLALDKHRTYAGEELTIVGWGESEDPSERRLKMGLVIGLSQSVSAFLSHCFVPIK